MVNKNGPIGSGGTWKTGQRVPQSGTYVDQFGVVTRHYRYETFPPCVGRKRAARVDVRGVGQAHD